MSNDFNSWSIPKRKSSSQPPQQQQQQQQQDTRRSMDMAIPRRRPQGGSGGGHPPPDLTASIPRRHSSNFDDTSIPRRGSMDSHGDRHGDRHHHKKIPRKKSHQQHHQQPQHQQHHYQPQHQQHQQYQQYQHQHNQGGSSRPQREAPPRNTGGIHVKSEYPFTIHIPLKGVPMDEGITSPPPAPPVLSSASSRQHRASSRTPKRKRPTYEEVAESDPDDFLTDSDDDHQGRSKKKKQKKKKRLSKASLPDAHALTGSAVGPSTAAVNDPNGAAVDMAASTNVLELNNTSLDAPPPGTLNTLWYSRECFLHVFVVEKILAWKTRPVTRLEWIPETIPEDGPPTNIPYIEPASAAKWSGMAVVNPLIWRDPKRRMEVSRLVPEQCPVVLTMASEAQPETASVRYRIKPLEEHNREEVYLVKWRGRSHLHSSWERGSDIIKYDQSNNTARHKIRRFVQSQETAMGTNWKKVLEEERGTFSVPVSAAPENTPPDGTPGGSATAKPAETEPYEEEYYPPAATEIERILACDENEMDLALFAKQRAMNIINEQESERQKEAGTVVKWNSKEGVTNLLKEIPWDPEDNVRYVVKWKGLPFAEMTWEYWRDIKTDAVEEAEEFWIRQKPPDERTIKQMNRPHPHIREFRKIQESPVFGISERERKVADLGQAKPPVEEDAEEAETTSGLRLRSYQLEGVNWLLFNWWNKRSCILADEMGLGKTIQSMSFIKTLQDLPSTGIRGPFLIVAPLSLIGQWRSEARTWAPDLNVVLYHGSADARDFLVKQDFYYTDQFVPKGTASKLKKQHVTKFHILITTYEVVLKDVNVISKIRWRALIVDEAHRLKNPRSRLFEELATVPRDYCVLLTGTPLANATEELWALLHFADNSAFSDKDEFLEKFGELKDAEQVNELHNLLKPYLLRRVKEDVEKSLPPKEETILEVSLTPIQKKYYKAIYERNTAFLFKGAKPSNAPSLMNVMMELRKCCNHPYLVRGAEERILADAANQARDGVTDYVKLFGEQLIKSSGKMVLISKLLPKLHANGHKVLIFSQMVRVLDLLEELLKLRKYKYERLDGSTSSSSRAAAVDRFVRKSCQRFVMLLSTRAGGLGLNLTAADIVIIFDSDWNPQNDLQAMARAHRIGQTRSVRVYRLLTAKTYEMHMFHSASMKLGLERAVLSQQRDQGGEDGEEGGKSKSKSDREAQAKEIDSLLKKGAYDVFRDDDDEEAQKFMETDIDQLLERNASTVTYDATQSNASGGLGSFSKASFVADTGDGEKDVDLDDPDFWSKAVGLDAPVETPEEVSHMLDDGVKRSRKQVQVFDPYAEFAEIEQRKQDKAAKKVKEEKEEKERIKMEKKKKKKDEKDRKQRDREDSRGSLFGKTSSSSPSSTAAPATEEAEEAHPKKQAKEVKLKKMKKGNDRKRALRRAQNEDPVLERLKQAWDVPQRSRAIAACLRFGFPRFCKIRHESNLTSLPIQDFEVFFRSYFFQLSLQVIVAFLQKMKDQGNVFSDDKLKPYLRECLGQGCTRELEWLSDCLSTGMHYYLEVESHRRFLRLPMTLADSGFVTELRRGAALRSLRRIFTLCRLERFVQDCSDDILTELGYEQLGKRGCQSSNIASMDADLKARLVSTEELSLAINSHLKEISLRSPVAWWDRSCDIALIIGTFIHGLGNYDGMLNDEALPFAFKLRKFLKRDEACVSALRRFHSATGAARKVFDKALESAKLKAQEEVQAVVAAAAAASTEREKDALALREGGTAADAVLSSMPAKKSAKLSDLKGDDSHYVTLPRLRAMLSSAVRSEALSSTTVGGVDDIQPSVTSSGDKTDTDGSQKATVNEQIMTMPDARVLDYRLSAILSEIERNAYPDEGGDMDIETSIGFPVIWPAPKIVSINCRVRANALAFVYGIEKANAHEKVKEFLGIGINGSQCASPHRSLDDGTDYSIGAASSDLVQIAYGSDAPRYLRALGVPMNLTRFALSSIIHASETSVNKFLSDEKQRSYLGVGEETSQPREGSMVEKKKPIIKTENKRDSSPPPPPVKKRLVPKTFQENSKLRASVCVVVLYYGIPSDDSSGAGTIYKSLWGSIREQCGQFDDVPPDELFGEERFMALVKEFAGKNTELPSFRKVKDYIESTLLPHCLRLAILGNGPSTRNARGSKGEYETAYGISVYPEPTKELQSPIPDPCLPVNEHSLEAVSVASAIVRRVRLMKTAYIISSGRFTLNQLDEVLHSSFMCRSMEGLPVWWCPWIHDAALLVHACSRGMFSVLRDRNSADDKVAPLAFSRNTILQHMYSTFVADDTALPRSIVDESPPEDAQAWIEQHSSDFPTADVLERRLSFLCARASETLDGNERYDNIPMFDHGGWPRN